jgi:Domain of unknown function (DUF4252)
MRLQMSFQMRTIALAIPVLLLLAATSGQAQELKSQPGYVPIEQLNLFPTDKASTEINIEGALLSLIAAGAKRADPDFASMIGGLKAITVRVFPLTDKDEAPLRARIGKAVSWLEGRGWKSTLRVKEKGEETYIYLKETGGKIAGLTLLSLTPGDEAVVINIVGRIDPAQLGRLTQTLDLPHIKQGDTKQGDTKQGKDKKPQKPE